jgi:bifunctional enzyme CysN/CysC/sulfate adenylyltransferase subunit 1
MATGASTADLAVILVDATKGILPQTRRHAFIASLLGIRHVLAAVNKMDLLEYGEDVFLDVERDFLQLAEQLGVAHVQCVPISALEGDNVVERSRRTFWYDGPTLLEHLETVSLDASDALHSLRFPVQMVIRPDATFRGFAGRVASGVIRPGDDVLALPSGQRTRVRSIVSYDGDLPEAFAPMSVTLRLEDEIDLSRGDMLVPPDIGPQVSRRFRAMVVWLHESPLEAGRTYVVKHTSRQTKIRALRIRHRVNVRTLEREPAAQLNMNDIGAVEFEAHVPLFFDPYASNRSTGSFILIDAMSNATVGAGMIEEGVPDGGRGLASLDIDHKRVSAQERYERHGHYPATFLVGDQPAIATWLERALFEQGFEVLHLDDREASSYVLLEVVRAAHAIGAVLIYSGRALDIETKQQLASEIGAGLHDLSEKTGHVDDEQFVRGALALADSLWFAKPKNNQEKVT